MRSRTGRRVLMIGLDSVDIEYLMSSLGSLPHLRGLFEGGRLKRLGSSADLLSASVWPTFSTGRPPGRARPLLPDAMGPEHHAPAPGVGRLARIRTVVV